MLFIDGTFFSFLFFVARLQIIVSHKKKKKIDEQIKKNQTKTKKPPAALNYKTNRSTARLLILPTVTGDKERLTVVLRSVGSWVAAAVVVGWRRCSAD